jgi:hypothetical protein
MTRELMREAIERKRELVREGKAHWKRMQRAPLRVRPPRTPGEPKQYVERPYARECALCQEYDDCAGCPVEAGGHRGCARTPYWHAVAIFHKLVSQIHYIHMYRKEPIIAATMRDELRKLLKDWRAAAGAEIDYLEAVERGLGHD